ncbi:hypothetical protein CVT24_007541 [Panaeolus cyanescens]|uniref:Uncharacterized protein n=1 Tax=Panaeolus cyanescens TaxID=181874 RepID=A0A409WLB7_9AGAR|nr:hypothetical protein CVT24_007541 [Panaeolus cyanescens]
MARNKFSPARKAWLLEQMPGFSQAFKDRETKIWISNLFRRFLKRFPLTSPLNVDPPEQSLEDVDENLPGNELVEPDPMAMSMEDYVVARKKYAEEKKAMADLREQILNFYYYHHAKSRSFNDNNNPFRHVFNVRDGSSDSNKPRKNSALNIWRKDFKDEIEAETSKVVAEILKSLLAQSDSNAKIEYETSKMVAEIKKLLAQHKKDKKDIPTAVKALLTKDEKGISMVKIREEQARNLYAKSVSAEERLARDKEADALHAAALKAWEAKPREGPSTRPEDRQRCIDSLPSVVQPLLDAICECTGWTASLMAGGPEPADGGRPHMTMLHSGRTKGPDALDFGEAEHIRLPKIVYPIFTKWLTTLYDPEECKSRAIQTPDLDPKLNIPVELSSANPPSQSSSAFSMHINSRALTPDDDDDLGLPGDPYPLDLESTKETSPASSSLPADSSASKSLETAAASQTGTSNTPELGGTSMDGFALETIRKYAGKPVESMLDEPMRVDVPVIGSESAGETGNAASGLNVQPTIAGLELENTTDEVATTGRKRHGRDMDEGEAMGKKVDEGGSKKKRMRRGGTSVRGEEGDGGKKRVPVTRRGGSVQEAVSNTQEARSRLRHGSSRPEGALVLSQHPSVDHPPTSTSNIGVSPSPAPPSNNSNIRFTSARGGSDWFNSAMTLFVTVGSENALGDVWTHCLSAYQEFQTKHGFAVERRLGTKNRPLLVSQWIGVGRTRVAKWRPSELNLKGFALEFNTWWSSIQPEWRLRNGDVISERVDGDWSTLLYPGVNGLLSVVGVLFFWGLEAKAVPSAHKEWCSAVVDCTVAFTALANLDKVE